MTDNCSNHYAQSYAERNGLEIDWSNSAATSFGMGIFERRLTSAAKRRTETRPSAIRYSGAFSFSFDGRKIIFLSTGKADRSAL